LNLYQLDYFLTLAETLNYTKASQKLHITQPNLSKTIVNLERSVGSQLLIRNKRDVHLTPAGKVFYEEIKKTMEAYENALTKTREMESGTSGVISLGFLGTAVIRLLPNIINTFYKSYPKIQITLTDYTYSPLIQALADNQLDVAILPDDELHTIPDLGHKHLFSDDMCVAVHHKHKFAERTQINLVELKDEPFVNMDPEISIRDFNLVNKICMEQDFLPNTVYESNTLMNMLMMVECQIGVTILASHMQHFATENVRFIKLKGYERYFKVVCAWRKDNNPSILKLLEVIDRSIGTNY